MINNAPLNLIRADLIWADLTLAWVNLADEYRA
jgi:hypothetical protein